MKRLNIFSFTACAFFLICSAETAVAQTQAGMVNRSGGGQTFDAEQYKIDRQKAQSGVNLNPNNYNAPAEFKKTGMSTKSNGEIWVDGFCRYRPAENVRSNYSKQTEINYMRAIYPSDTVTYADNFGGKGNINWDLYRRSISNDSSRSLKKLIADNLADGIPVPVFNSIVYTSKYFAEGNLGWDYEFSRAVKIWVKRASGPEKMYLEFKAQYNCTNGDDATVFKINDNGNFDISDRCNNCKSTANHLKSGKASMWVKGDWNELAIAKDNFNTIRIFVNNELIYQYQEANIPIATRYGLFQLDLPADAEKKDLVYRVGQLAVVSYPEIK